MKFFKKAISLFAAMFVCLGIGCISACSDDDGNSSTSSSSSVSVGASSSSTASSASSSSSSSSVEETLTADTNYRIGVQTMNGYGLRNVTVSLYSDDNVLMTSKKTGSSGYVNFKEEDVELGTYTVGVDLPYGYEYAYESVYQTTANKGMTVEIVLRPKGLVAGSQAPAGTTYKLGDVMYDFSMTTSDNQTFTLSQVLEDKDMVMLNFWATWCGPCKVEFPAMSTAYTLYQEYVEIFAISTTDTKASVADFKEAEGLPFPMAHNQNGFEALFPKNGIPLTVIVDRYGVISYWHNANMTATSDFTDLFDLFIGEDYTPTVRGESAGGDEEGGGSGGGIEQTKPTISAPRTSEIKEVLGNDAFTYRWQADENEEDEYSWPWGIGQDSDNVKYIYATNRNVHNSYAQLYAKFSLEAPTKDKVLAFDLKLWTEKDGDYFYVFIDGVPVQSLCGQRNGGDWGTCYAYVFDEFDAGEHEIVFVYQKDVGSSAGDDTVQIKNLRFLDLSNVVDQDMGHVFHYAAEGTPSAQVYETQQFAHYITPVFNETDGYYHVNSEDGPILFANMMNTSPWSESSVWLLAYSDYVIEDGFNYKSAIEDYAWAANNNMVNFGYAPVTQDLRELLDITVRNVNIYNKWDGEYHDKEWLELCVYYQHYGTTEAFEDPTKNITFHGATELTISMDKANPILNEVRVQFAMNPRGFKYKLIPQQSGVYNFYSLGESDTEAWLVDEDTTTFYGFWQETFKADGTVDNNFNFNYYLEAGKTYYLLCTTFLDQTALYDVVIAYQGASITYWQSAASGDYSFNPATNEIFITDCVDYAYDQTNDVYRVVDSDGNMGEELYLNVTYMPKKWFKASISSVVAAAATVPVQDRAFYVDGVDYTDEMQRFCTQAERNGGFIKVSQEVYDVLYAVTMSTKFDGIEGSWLFLCYYRATLSS